MIPAIFGLSGTVLTAAERAFFKAADPAGYILFGRNVSSRKQLRGLTDSLRSLHGREHLLISIDQEGGRVARLRPPVASAYPPAQAFDRLYDLAPASAIAAALANGHALGLELADLGITLDHAPVCDLRQPGAHDVIGDRAFGAEPLRVAALARATLDGLARGGVAGTIKHLPGHGRTTVDAHLALPTIDASAQELEADLAPFIALSHAPVGMTGHLRFTAWDAENPVTLSRIVIEQVIRGRIGFDGLLLTDDLDMEALGGPVPQRAARAIAAGCDLALNCWANMDDMMGIAHALPEISMAGAARLARALAGTAVTRPDLAAKAEQIAIRDTLLALAPEPGRA